MRRRAHTWEKYREPLRQFEMGEFCAGASGMHGDVIYGDIYTHIYDIYVHIYAYL